MANSERSTTRPEATVRTQSQPNKVAVTAEPLCENTAQQLAQAYGRNTVAAD